MMNLIIDYNSNTTQMDRCSKHETQWTTNCQKNENKQNIY